MSDPKLRDVLYCECANGQCVCEIGYEKDHDINDCKKPHWKKMPAFKAFDMAQHHKRLQQTLSVDSGKR
jgi:hypothetical protein